MIIYFQKLPNCPVNQLYRKYDTDAGFDLCVAEDTVIWPTSQLKAVIDESFEPLSFEGVLYRRYKYEKQLIPTGITIAPEQLAWTMLVPRSSVALNFLFGLRNEIGVIDCDFRNQVMIAAINHGMYPIPFRKGERIAQLIPIPQLQTTLQLVEQPEGLPATQRGLGGFGSTGT